jgi:hypothetical protein
LKSVYFRQDEQDKQDSEKAEEEGFYPRRTHLNCYKPLKINTGTLGLMALPASGERTRPRVQRVAPRGPHQNYPSISTRLPRSFIL